MSSWDVDISLFDSAAGKLYLFTKSINPEEGFLDWGEDVRTLYLCVACSIARG